MPRRHRCGVAQSSSSKLRARPKLGPASPKPTLGGFWRGVTVAVSGKQSVVPQAVPHPYMMHMLGRGQWVRQGSMRSDARVSGEYATKL